VRGREYEYKRAPLLAVQEMQVMANEYDLLAPFMHEEETFARMCEIWRNILRHIFVTTDKELLDAITDMTEGEMQELMTGFRMAAQRNVEKPRNG
jgi:hypothetical protein